MSSKVSPVELENLRSKLIEKTSQTTSSSLKLFYYYNFFQTILVLNNPNIEEAFLKEFSDEYLTSLSRFEAWGTNPDFTKKVINQLKRLSELKNLGLDFIILNQHKERLEEQLKELEATLNGNDISEYKRNKAYFPLLNFDTTAEVKGIIDSITVNISKANEEKIIIVPSEKEIEKRISEQCNNSWNLVLTSLKQYVKNPYKHHEVIINFDKREGFYEGNSLGVALTLTLLEALLKFYNPPYEININGQIAFTGGVTGTGLITSTGEEIIKQKIGMIFFSTANSFVIPKEDEASAYLTLKELKASFPSRKLKLIAVGDFNDIINRRDIVEIKKRNPVIRTGRFIKKNWISAAATVLLAIIFAYLFVMDFDDNPAFAFYDSNQIFITNKSSKKLFSFPFFSLWGNSEIISKYLKIIDINNDGLNEILFVESPEAAAKNNLKVQSLSCYNINKKLLWNFNFNEIVSSKREVMTPGYGIKLIDTVTENDKNIIVVYASNDVSFASAIFKIDLLTGQKISNAFWCSGYINDAILADINTDGKKEFVGWGPDNGFEQPVIWAMHIDTLQGARPTTLDYQIKGKPEPKMLFYIRTPNTDYDHFVNHRVGIASIVGLSFDKINYKLKFNTQFNEDIFKAALLYRLDVRTLDINIFIDDNYRILRDSLVTHGKLKPPYTDTKEYINNLKKQILYWKPNPASAQKGEWVKREEVD